jgi:predicted dienelactone hydrolase
VLFSHGVTALGSIYGNVTSQWASAGYVVAAPDYPLSNNKAPGGPTINDTKNQPADASFVIDQVLADDGSAFAGIVDPQRIGAAGHSLGAVTTYGLVYSACCRDDRIGAAIVFAGATVLVDTPDRYFRGVRTPLLAVHGDADPIVPYSLGLDAWRRAHAPKFLVTITGGNHLQPYLGGDDARTLAFYEYTTAFLDRYLKDDQTALRRFHVAVDAPGSGATLRQQVR